MSDSPFIRPGAYDAMVALELKSAGMPAAHSKLTQLAQEAQTRPQFEFRVCEAPSRVEVTLQEAETILRMFGMGSVYANMIAVNMAHHDEPARPVIAITEVIDSRLTAWQWSGIQRYRAALEIDKSAAAELLRQMETHRIALGMRRPLRLGDPDNDPVEAAKVEVIPTPPALVLPEVLPEWETPAPAPKAHPRRFPKMRRPRREKDRLAVFAEFIDGLEVTR